MMFPTSQVIAEYGQEDVSGFQHTMYILITYSSL